MPVVVLHERLDALEHVGLVVAQVGRDPGLDLEVEHVGGMLAHVVEFIADSQKKIVGVLEVAQL